MPKLRTLSAKKVLSIFDTFGFSAQSQRGSHIKLVRITKEGRHILTIPNHKELDKGTVRAIYAQALRYISEDNLRKYFFTE